MMPRVFKVGSFVFFFWSDERQEPPHIHVRRGSKDSDAIGKWWIDPVAMVEVEGFNVRERTKIESIVRERKQELLDAWNKHFGRS
jgi:hypothetical protein